MEKIKYFYILKKINIFLLTFMEIKKMKGKSDKQVLHTDGFTESFKPKLIKEYLLNVKGVSEDLASKITLSISRKINGLDEDIVTTQQIRAEVTSRLTSEGFEEEPSIIITESDIMSLLLDYDF